MFKSISDALVPFLKEQGLWVHAKKIWPYKGKCLVVDFAYRGIGFNFDLTPSKDGLVSIDIVQRKSVSGVYITPTNARKSRLANQVTIAKAFALLKANADQVLSRIDAYLDDRTESNPSIRREEAPEEDGVALSRPMTVGVLTLPLNKNFGGNLQAFAMMETLRQLGHRPVLIKRRHPLAEGIEAELDTVEEPLLQDSYGMSSAIPNSSFIDKHITPVTKQFHSSSQLAQNIGRYGFDALVVGSDQVWRAKYARTILLDFFFGFLPDEDRRIKRISYAASFGADKLAYGESLGEAARLARRFDAISVREDSAVALCRDHFGVDAQHVLDPTLLLSPDDYVRLFSDRDFGYTGDRLLTYVLDADGDKGKVISEISKRLSLAAYATNGLPFGSVSALKAGDGDRSIEGWLASFHGAAFVVTDSFHGVAFSILFNKPFIAYGNPKRGMARFVSLLKMFGMEDRLVVHSDKIDLDRLLLPIDWNKVNRRLGELRQASMDFLVSAISESRPSTVASDPPRETISGHRGYRQQASVEAQIFEDLSRRLFPDANPSKAHADLLKQLIYDGRRFFIHSGVFQKGSSALTRGALITKNYHAIEKGLSLAKTRPGFGEKRIKKLAKLVEEAIHDGICTHEVTLAIDSLVGYQKFNEQHAIEPAPWIVKALGAAERNGFIPTGSPTKELHVARGESATGLDFILSRASVRDYSSAPVPDEVLQAAVRSAQAAPCVCNRQAGRVYLIRNPAMKAAALGLQNGNRGFGTDAPVVAIITVDLAEMMEPTERYQHWIDGGMFAQNFLLGIHVQGYGACPLNWSASSDKDLALRELGFIADSESVIMMVSVGALKESYKVARSERRQLESVMRIL